MKLKKKNLQVFLPFVSFLLILFSFVYYYLTTILNIEITLFFALKRGFAIVAVTTRIESWKNSFWFTRHYRVLATLAACWLFLIKHPKFAQLETTRWDQEKKNPTVDQSTVGKQNNISTYFSFTSVNTWKKEELEKKKDKDLTKHREVFWISLINSSPEIDTSFLCSLSSITDPDWVETLTLPSGIRKLNQWGFQIWSETPVKQSSCSESVSPAVTRSTQRSQCQGWWLGRWCHQSLFSLLTTRLRRMRS